MSEAIEVTRDQAIIGFMRVLHPENVAAAEKLVDELVKLGVKGIAAKSAVASPEQEKP